MAAMPHTTSSWLHEAINRIEADYQRSADTHLIPLPLPGFADLGIDLYLKDESTHPTGSLKHRLARSLFLYALCNGWVHEGSTIVEASSGSTAVSEAYFARLLGLPFVAVMPRSTSAEKIALIELYGKDESTHPTGSLKHRLARSLFLYALCNGWVHEGSTIVEASSGSTAVSEAYFARLLGLPFVAVMPRSTSAEKIALIEFYGGRCHLVDSAGQVYDEARAVAAQTGGHYMDQFTYAERATDWRGNNNIAESMFTQMRRERHAVPRWIVVGAGTGGTSATIGRYVRFQRHATGICVADPEGSVFAAYHRTGDATLTAPGSRIEGIGRPRVEPSFVRTLVDRMEEVADCDSRSEEHTSELQSQSNLV